MDWGPMKTPFPAVSFELGKVRELASDQDRGSSVTG